MGKFILQDETQSKEWDLLGDALYIGRSPDNDIVLPFRQVSRRHAALSRDRGRWFVTDLGSINGTGVNGQPIDEPRMLFDGEMVSIAEHFQLLFLDPANTLPIESKIRSEDLLPHIRHNTPVPRSPRTTGLLVELRSHRVWVNGEELNSSLSLPQYQVLACLYQRSGEVVSRDDIEQLLWPDASPSFSSYQAIDSLLCRLRKRLAAHDSNHTYIQTVRGHGFRLVQP